MFKSNKKSRTVLIAIAVILALSVTALGKTVSENAKLFYNNIKIYIDGAEIVPKDAVGNVVEPFIINGTTYLPVRAISNALCKDVEWDGKTQSVYIGKKDQTKPDNYLHKIQYNDYKAGNTVEFAIINGTITDYNGNTYTNGLVFDQLNYFGKVKDDEDKANVNISYPLNSQYSRLKGKIVIPKTINISSWAANLREGASSVDVWFYGDGNLLYKAPNVVRSLPFSFDIDIKGVNQLTIKVKTNDASGDFAALTDLALYK